MTALKKYSTLVLSHWYTVVDGVHFSTEEFYKAIEQGLRDRKVPGLRISRVAFLEGSVVSDKRLYLRLSREQFAFDLCAAPFGRAYFFSLRFVERGKSWIKLLFFLGAISALFGFITARVHSLNENLLFAGVGGLGCFLLFKIVQSVAGEAQKENNRKLGVQSGSEGPSFGDFISGVAVIGNWYDRIRRDTYFRYDTRIMYHRLISDLVKETVAEVTAEKGTELRREWDYSPLFDDLYKMKTVESTEAGVA